MDSGRKPTGTPGQPGARGLFHIVDPNLRNVVGHYFEYDRAVAEGARDLGYRVVIHAHRDVEPGIAARVGAQPVFSRDIWGLAGRGGGRITRMVFKLRDNARFLHELIRGLWRAGLPRGSVVFAHTFVDRQLAALALLGLLLCCVRGTRLVLLLRYQPEFYADPLCALSFRLIEALARRNRIHLTTDSARLAEQLGRLTTRPVHVLPIPHVPPDIASSGPAATGETCFVSLGNARDEKGMFEILDAIRLLHERGQLGGLRFVLQCNDAAPDVQAAIDAFAGLGIPNCVLLHDKLESDSYYGLLRDADIVLLPYWRSIYFGRTSGVFMEALSAGKPVIATTDTWMSDQLADHGAGLLTRDRSPEVLAALMLRAAAQRDALGSAARANRSAWLETHNPRALAEAIDALDDARRQAATPPRRALILYPHDDVLSRQGGASRRVNLLADFLIAAGLEVRILQGGVAPRTVEPNGLVVESLGREQRMPVRRAWVGLRVWLLGLGRGMRHRWMFWQYSRIGADARHLRHVRQQIRWADVVTLEYPFWAAAVQPIARAEGRRVVLTPYDVLSDQLTGVPALRAWGWWRERRAWAAADHLVAVSIDDAQRMMALGLKPALAPNPTDGRLFEVARLGDGRAILRDVYRIDLADRRVCLFIGSFFEPNIRAVAAIRDMAAATPEIAYVIAGGCAEAEDAGNFRALGRVDDAVLLLLYAACDIVLVPIPFGTGSSLKTVEGMAAGRVLIGTDAAFRGLDVADGREVVIANDPAAYPDLIRALLADPARCQALAEGARRFARAYDSRVAYLPYLSILGVPQPTDPGFASAVGMIDASLLQIGQAALRVGRAEVAAAMAREVLRTSPGDTDAEAMLLLSQGGGRAAERETDGAWAWAREQADTWARFARQDYETVIRRAERALRENDRLADAHFLLAQSLHNLGTDPDGALRHYTRALGEGYPAYWVRLGRARLLREEGQYQAALRDVALAWPLMPVSGAPVAVIGETVRAIRGAVLGGRRPARMPEVTADIRQAIWADHARGDFAVAVTSLRGLASIDGDAELQFLLALCLHDGRIDLDAAERAYQRAEALGWDPTWIGLCRGRLLREAGQSSAALSLLVPAMLRRPHRRAALSCARQIMLTLTHWNQVGRPVG